MGRPGGLRWCALAASLVALGVAVPAAESSAPKVDSVEVHESFNEPTASANDVALLALAQPAAFAPLPLVGADELWEQGDTSTIVGWGTTEFGGDEGSDVLLEAEVPITGDQACEDAYGPEFDDATMVCAGDGFTTPARATAVAR